MLVIIKVFFVRSSAVDNADFVISCGQESRDQLGLSAIAWQAICDVTATDHELSAVCSRAWQRVKQGRRKTLMSSPIVHDPIVGFMYGVVGCAALMRA